MRILRYPARHNQTSYDDGLPEGRQIPPRDNSTTDHCRCLYELVFGDLLDALAGDAADLNICLACTGLGLAWLAWT